MYLFDLYQYGFTNTCFILWVNIQYLHYFVAPAVSVWGPQELFPVDSCVLASYKFPVPVQDAAP